MTIFSFTVKYTERNVSQTYRPITLDCFITTMQYSILLLQHRYLKADHLGEIATTRLSTLHRTFILERCSSQAASNFTRSPSWKRWHHHLAYTQSSEARTSHRNCQCSGLKCSSLGRCFCLILQCFCWLTCLVVGGFTSELYDSHDSWVHSEVLVFSDAMT